MLRRLPSVFGLAMLVAGCYATTYAPGAEMRALHGLSIANPRQRKPGVTNEGEVIHVRPDAEMVLKLRDGTEVRSAFRQIVIEDDVVHATLLQPGAGALSTYKIPLANIDRLGVRRFSMNRTFMLIALLATPLIVTMVVCNDPQGNYCGWY